MLLFTFARLLPKKLRSERVGEIERRGHLKLKCNSNSYTSIVASIYPADKKDFRLNPYRVFGVNGAEPRY